MNTADSDPLKKVREEINALDSQLIRLLKDREELVSEVARIKHKFGLPIRDKGRERMQIRRFMAECTDRKIPHLTTYVLLVMRTVIESSVLLQGDTNAVDLVGKNLFCEYCNWNTTGEMDANLKWPVCPACRIPLLCQAGPNGKGSIF